MTSSGHQAAGVKLSRNSTPDPEQTASNETPQTECVKLARALRVNRNEVALLRLEKNCLRFIYPPELREAGFVPLTGSAVAARTASTRSPLLSNSFARVRHVSLFESVKLGGSDADNPGSRQMPIQKIMSVPIIGSDRQVIGVVQVSRKGLDPKLAGDDFTSDDLKQLEKAAEALAGLPFMREGAEF